MLATSLGMRRKLRNLAATTALVLALAACGGGGGGGSGLNSTPPPPPPPPPPTKTCPDGSVIPADQPCPPPPPQFTKIFPSITTTTDFAVLGVQANSIPATSLETSGFSVRYDAVAGAYVFDLPSVPPANFSANSESNTYWGGWLGVGSTWPGYHISVFKPSSTNPEFTLSHTTFATFYDYDYDDYAPVGFVAFGTATPASSVPTTGSATFDAIVRGLTTDGGRDVQGTASLQFNFGDGTLAGSFSPTTYSEAAQAYVGLGPYNFVSTVFSVGSTNFSGQLQHAGTSTLGTFDGLFTGPAAQELMARWTAPYLNPNTNQWSDMFGIWVGKRCC